MARISAKNGVGTWEAVALTDVTDIVVNEDDDTKVYASSSTAGNKSRISGHTDREGSFEVIDDSLPFSIGETGTLKLESVSGTVLFTGEVKIMNISYAVPIESGDPVKAVVQWGQEPTATP